MTTTLKPGQWAAVQTVFHKVADLPAAEREHLLAELCAADKAMEQAVRELLRGEEQDVPSIDDGVDAVAGRVLVDPSSVLTFGPYRVVRPIGEGGMGVIYLARRDDVGQTVAIKVLRNRWLSPMGRQRFAAEQRALARLNHPSIAPLYDSDTDDDGMPWFAMEYVEGRPLTDAAQQDALSFTERLKLFRDVCEAVQHAHQHLIVHRDLKPSNVLVTTDRRVKLLDFGIAKQLDLIDEASSAQTATAARLMTLNYAAPEQLTGGVVGIHTDVYALGAILYELLTGRVPLELTNGAPLEAHRALTERLPVKPSVVARTEKTDLQATRSNWTDVDVLCLKALQKSPERRYRTVDAMMDDIDRLLTGRPLNARPDSIGYRTSKFVRRHWQGTLVATAAICIVTVLTGYYTVKLRVARDIAVDEAARASRVLLFMEKLFEGGESDEAPAQDLRVLTLVDRGTREARSLDAWPDMQAQLYEVLGTIYQNLGELDKADELLQASVKTSRAIGPGQESASSLIALGLLRTDQAKLEEAESLARAALDMATRTLPAEHPTIAKAQLAVGKVLRDRGQYVEAVEHLDRAVAGYSASPQTEAELGSALTVLANTHYYAGRLDRSESLNQRVLALDRKAYGDNHPAVGDDLINLGAIADALGRPSAAVPRYREALSIFEGWYGPRHPETASAMTGLAQVLFRMKQNDEALQLFTRAHDVYSATYKTSHPRQAMALSGMGLVALERGQFDVAEDAFERSLTIYRDVYGTKHSRIAAALVNLASLAIARQDPSGESLLREALQMYETTLSRTHATTAATRVRLGRYLIAQKRYAEAEEQLLQAKQALTTQPVPQTTSLRAVMDALAQVFDATGRRDIAERTRMEMSTISD